MVHIPAQRTPLEQAAQDFVTAYENQRRKVANGQPITTADRAQYERAERAWTQARNAAADVPADQPRAAA